MLDMQAEESDEDVGIETVRRMQRVWGMDAMAWVQASWCVLTDM